nr:electron transfer flavoprotein subunit beta/FixA family protein [Chloroflexota bacterium]
MKNVLVCIKRVPATGSRITLTPDEQEIDARYLNFTFSPHEECAVEEAVRLIEAHGGTSVVLTLGPDAATDILVDAMALGMERAVLLETESGDWDPGATAAAIVEAVRAQQAAGTAFDLILMGNEAADTGDYQVGIRVAHVLGLPCVTGVKELKIDNGNAVARREVKGGWEVFEAPLPAVVTVKEGINLPRYPSLRGRLTAKKKPIERMKPQRAHGGWEKVRFKVPPEQTSVAVVLGKGAEAAPLAVDLLQRLGVL